MPKGKRRVFTREFQLSAVKRMVGGERVAALSRELHVPRGHLYNWCIHFRSGGPEALRPACRPRKGMGVLDLEASKDLATARKRISELERKVGQQQVAGSGGNPQRGRRPCRAGVYAISAAMTSPRPEGERTVERMCVLAGVN